MPIVLNTAAFKDGGAIPKTYTGDGEDISPAFSWNGAPSGTQEFALVCEDPDAPGRTFIHWVVYKIPLAVAELRERLPDIKSLPGGVRQGVNDFGRVGYNGPHPPPGSLHRYFFKLFALSGPIELEAGATADQLEKAMRGSVLETAQIIGRYQR